MTINLRRETHQMTLEKSVTNSDDDPTFFTSVRNEADRVRAAGVRLRAR
jgi:hypothetical protein